ncbi:MAG TPA: CAP domain-containing protein [Candidatus Blautia stercoravium]|nr:CAP domain-containing protein [Candidatus Blautia stercoravium]
MKRFFSMFLIAMLLTGFVPGNLQRTTVQAAEMKNYTPAGLPAEIKDLWLYVGGPSFSDPDSGRTWVWGHAYGKTQPWINGQIDTSSKDYENAYKRVQANAFLKEAKIAILYLPNCPYTKTYLPIFQDMAQQSGAKVLAIDVMKYRSGSLMPYYQAGVVGGVSPIVLYEKSDGSLGGESGVHSAAKFAEILRAAGFNASVPEDTSGYSSEQEYKDEVLSETNRQRIAKGFLPVSSFQSLQDVADLRAEEIVKNMSHTRPDGTPYVTLIQQHQISGPNLYGENIAAGPAVATPYSVMNAWMNSPAHRTNILNGNYTHMGVGYFANTLSDSSQYKDYWVQLFSGTCKYDKSDITLSQSSIQVGKGIPISDMDITVKFECPDHGTSTMPLIDEMVSGYNMNEPGIQRVYFNYGDIQIPLDITVGDVEPITLTENMVKLETSNVVYTGMEQRPAVSVMNDTGDFTLLEGYSYTATYENNVNVGVAKVTIVGKGNYKGTITREFQITPADLSTASVEGIQDTYNYTGSPLTPTVTVKLGKQTLYENKDFTVQYADNTGELKVSPTGATPPSVSGTATVTITGTGNYTAPL